MQQDIMRLLQRAAADFQRGDFSAALGSSEAALSLSPDHPEGLHMKALALGRLGRTDEALPAFDKAAENHPQKHAILANKGNALRAAVRDTEAVKAYQDALAANAVFLPAWMGLGNAYRRLGDYKNAEDAFRRGSEATLQNAEFMNNLGLVFTDQNRNSEAVDMFSAALAQKPLMLSALVNRGAALRQLGQYEAALADLRKAVALAPDSAEAHYQIGSCLRHLGSLKDAENALQRAIALAPERIDIHRDLARMLWEMGKEDSFLDPLDRTIEATPAPDLLTLKSELAYMAGRADLAESAAERAIKANSTDAAPWRIIGCIRRREGDLVESIEVLQQALAHDPKDFKTLHELASTLLAAGEHQRAYRLLDCESPAENLQTHIALKCTAMRLLGNPDYRRYYDYDRFARKIFLEPPSGYADLKSFNQALAEAIRPLHATKTQPIDQTLYGGTQSVGRLWDEPDPVIQAMKTALLKAASRYVEELPDDPNHPFLARKSLSLECAGAWSVMLSSGGGHVDHIHPEGWISASYYVRVPDEILSGEKAGFLRLGASGVEGVHLEAERWFRPEEGTVIFFPSYMWHGVENFTAPTPRITAPFDLSPVLSTH